MENCSSHVKCDADHFPLFVHCYKSLSAERPKQQRPENISGTEREYGWNIIWFAWWHFYVGDLAESWRDVLHISPDLFSPKSAFTHPLQSIYKNSFFAFRNFSDEVKYEALSKNNFTFKTSIIKF